MTAPIRVGILHDMAESVAETVSLGGHVDAIMRLAIDDLVAARPARSRRRVRPRRRAGAACGYGVRDRACVRRARRAGRAPDRRPGGRRQRPGRDAARGSGAGSHDQLGGNGAARSDFMFHLQVGSHEDESVLLARHVASLGAQRVGVVLDRSPIGRRYASFFEAECEALGLEPRRPCVDRTARRRRDAGGRHGAGLRCRRTGLPRARARRHRGRPGAHRRRVGRAGGDEHGRTARVRPEYAREIDGWVYVDMVADDNAVLAGVRDRLDADESAGPHRRGRLRPRAAGRRRPRPRAELTAEGVRDGLELVKLRAVGRGARRDHAGLRPLGPWCPPRPVPRAPSVARRSDLRSRR